jgi:hypothetical protein
MGVNSTKERQSLIANIQSAKNDLSSPLDSFRIAQAERTLASIRKEVARLKQNEDPDIRIELESFEEKINNCAIRLSKLDAAEHERRAWQKRVDKASRELDIARENWQRNLKQSVQELRHIEQKKPGGMGTDWDPIVTAEDITKSLAKKKAEITDLEELVSASPTWNDTAIVKWYDERENKSQGASEQAERLEQQRAEKLAHPRLAEAIAQLKIRLGPAVEQCVKPLADADLNQILVPTPIPDNGERAALSQFAPPMAGVSTANQVHELLDKSGFPAGTIEKKAKELISAWSENGAGPGARLRAVSADIVVSGNEAGFNIQDATVFEFFKNIARITVSDMGSDSGSRQGPDYRGEFNAENKRAWQL